MLWIKALNKKQTTFIATVFTKFSRFLTRSLLLPKSSIWTLSYWFKIQLGLLIRSTIRCLRSARPRRWRTTNRKCVACDSPADEFISNWNCFDCTATNLGSCATDSTRSRHSHNSLPYSPIEARKTWLKLPTEVEYLNPRRHCGILWTP